ncbi:MAG TPA: FKBP-type peptidyl-prolyl cis-trans isomerase [Chitinophagaceae bacterium]|nr:FKBP-type peptidyl-prolyl cis-trans isomerase [Chitinophagaceae bacterium]
MEIAEKMVVSLRYILKNSEGEEVENTITGSPVQYVHGAGKILPQLEILLKGLKAGDKKSVTVELPDIFHFNIEIDEIRMATTEEIEAGVPITRDDCGPGCCC